jgi:hypothetical protein
MKTCEVCGTPANHCYGDEACYRRGYERVTRERDEARAEVERLNDALDRTGAALGLGDPPDLCPIERLWETAAAALAAKGDAK